MQTAQALNGLKQGQLHPAFPSIASFFSGMPAVRMATKRSAHRTVTEAY